MATCFASAKGDTLPRPATASGLHGTYLKNKKCQLLAHIRASAAWGRVKKSNIATRLDKDRGAETSRLQSAATRC